LRLFMPTGVSRAEDTTVTDPQWPVDPFSMKGKRVRLHPATDWFMRGVTYAVITSIKWNIPQQRYVYYLRPDTMGLHTPKRLRIKLIGDYILD